MRRYGVNIGELGAHSVQKGASAYMASGYFGGTMKQEVNINIVGKWGV